MTLDDLEGSLCTLFQNIAENFYFHIQHAFSRQMTAGAIMALTFHKLKQITSKSHWVQEKHAASCSFLAIA